MTDQLSFELPEGGSYAEPIDDIDCNQIELMSIRRDLETVDRLLNEVLNEKNID